MSRYIGLLLYKWEHSLCRKLFTKTTGDKIKNSELGRRHKIGVLLVTLFRNKYKQWQEYLSFENYYRFVLKGANVGFGRHSRRSFIKYTGINSRCLKDFSYYIFLKNMSRKFVFNLMYKVGVKSYINMCKGFIAYPRTHLYNALLKEALEHGFKRYKINYVTFRKYYYRKHRKRNRKNY